MFDGSNSIVCCACLTQVPRKNVVSLLGQRRCNWPLMRQQAETSTGRPPMIFPTEWVCCDGNNHNHLSEWFPLISLFGTAKLFWLFMCAFQMQMDVPLTIHAHLPSASEEIVSQTNSHHSHTRRVFSCDWWLRCSSFITKCHYYYAWKITYNNNIHMKKNCFGICFFFPPTKIPSSLKSCAYSISCHTHTHIDFPRIVQQWFWSDPMHIIWML